MNAIMIRLSDADISVLRDLGARSNCTPQQLAEQLLKWAIAEASRPDGAVEVVP